MTGPALPGKRPGHGNGRGYGQVQARSCRSPQVPRNANRMPREQSAIGGVRALRRGWLPLRAPAHGSLPDQRARPRRMRKPRPAAAPASTSLILSPTIADIERDRGRGPRSPAGSCQAWACATDDRDGTGRYRAPGDRDNDRRGHRGMLRRKAIAHPTRQIGVGLLVEARPTRCTATSLRVP